MSNDAQAVLTRLSPRRPAYRRDLPVYIDVPQPEIGNKFFCPTGKGVYVLEKGPGMFVGWLCTAAGSGGVFVYDGVPNEEGLFEGREEGLEHARATGVFDFNGREIYTAVPPIMQPWQMNAGFKYGLTLEVTGNDPAMPSWGAVTIGTATWQKHKAKAEKKSL